MLTAYKYTLFVVAISSAFQAAAQTISDLAPFNGGSSSSSNGVSASGDVVVGDATDGNAGDQFRAFRWTSSGGMLDLGTLNGGLSSHATATNATGDVVVGSARDGNAGNNFRAFRWTQTNGMVSLGSLNGGSNSYAAGVNALGDVVVGGSADGNANNAFTAYRWTQSGGMVSLGMLNGGTHSSATGVNALGDVVVGNAYDGSASNAQRAFRWTQAGGMISLGTINGGTTSSANGINAVGDVVVGVSDDGSAGNAQRAFRWTQAGGMVSLGTLNGGTSSFANGVNASGDVVVGSATDGNAGNAQRAFRWTSSSGMQTVESWLASNGISMIGTNTSSANATNADGSVVVGALANNHAFIARVVNSGVGGAGSGLIDVQSFNGGLNQAAAAHLQAINNAEIVVNGMHSNLMRTLLPKGHFSFWVAGDAGRQDHGSSDSSLGMSEVGYGYRFNDTLQLNISMGRTYSKTNADMGGNATSRSTFFMPDLIVTLSPSFYFSASAYYGRGRTDIDRGYLNAGNLEHVFASPKVESQALRLRVDWLNAVSRGEARFSPYASLTYLKNQTDGYIEQGGSFPAIWDQRLDHASTARLGVDVLYPLSNSTMLQGRVEAAHRFQKFGSPASGQVIGLYSFSFAGQELKQDWLRLGAGIETEIGRGIATLMLNATTQGEAPSYWLMASYRWVF
ncbi:HAF family repeat protein [Herbaspirillum sp. CF444]|uniref:autotransporter domain-containing protein n=1 Tax=Herbaspirillum sp. CF444 TaxID=1144319 RepID=UPI00027233BF|nr:autotransporter domain-containing protein [Herbaspirillum sp. CF444]EJL88744.1 HAF family repeat protein [Herbaspirillum sp. CF444]